MPSFRAKARAVDLLGKGQIADLPTAVCELWKTDMMRMPTISRAIFISQTIKI
ncbi:MAG: hypothetical protein DIAAKJNI_00320 [Candidatus Argoarchaeum ethanivorans]|uniref:Uncharacterized protein n=1 Tax=Candidatus Argoarchaeum ethanivorans TaxID=2608793 RepID=A0A811T5E8_9EURY|nr:MAG: hypothetical protein DIAAKJNI_00320 [Candidatus Argoarchaeum ethanivorans]